MNARDEILATIRKELHVPAANPAASYGSIARAYRRMGSLDRSASLHLFIDRLLDYNAQVIEVASDAELAGAIAGALHAAGETVAVVAPELPRSWLPASVELRVDDGLPAGELEGIPAVITTCQVAVAASGTILLVHGGAQGRRIATLLPDHHLCLVRRDQVVEVLPEALAQLAPYAQRPITTISGPSATSDIEMTRIRGVHGPRRLTVILFG